MTAACDVCSTWGIETCAPERVVASSTWGAFSLSECPPAFNRGWPPLWAALALLETPNRRAAARWREVLAPPFAEALIEVLEVAGWTDEQFADRLVAGAEETERLLAAMPEPTPVPFNEELGL